MATTVPYGLYKPANGEDSAGTSWNTLVTANFQTLNNRMNDLGVNAKATSYGAVGNGSTNDKSALAAGLLAAEGGVLYIPAGVYMCNNLGAPAGGVTIKGVGSGKTVLKKNANGPIFLTGADKVTLDGVSIDGNGGTYTGPGIEVYTSNWFTFINGRIENTAAHCVDYVTNSGAARSLLANSVMYTTTATPSGTPAIRYPPADVNGDRYIVNVDCNGGRLADFAGCQTALVTMCNTSGVIFGTASHKVSLIGNRVATGGAETVVKGFQHAISGNIFAGGLHLTTLVSSAIAGNVVVDATTLTIDSDCRYNTVDYQGLGVTLTDNSTPGYNSVRINAGVATGAYTVTNPTTDRALNVTGDTLPQVAQVLGTLIADLQSNGTLR